MAITTECKEFGILVEIDDGVTRDKCIIVSKAEFKSVTKPDPGVDQSLCGSLCADCGCNFVEPVFPGDFTPIYVEQQIDTDIITFEIRKADGTGQIIIDQSLGEFSANEFYKADWNAIRNLFGGGVYKIIITSIIIGVETVSTSHEFQLTKFDECIADGWVKFQWIQKGSVQDGREFDPERNYETRLPGNMIEETPEEDEETYQNNNRSIKQIQKTVKRIYKFKSYLIQYAQKEMIIENMLIANEYIITDLNVNTKEFTNKSLYLTSIDELVDHEGSNYYTVILAFTDLKQDLIKRPCTDD